MWVEEMKSMNDRSPVILYKPQGTTQSSESNNLCDRDFVLAIQTSLQADIMMVVDEYGEGFPVAWCISNREDKLLLMNFFNALKMRVGSVEPAWFMSDLTEQYYTTWISSFRGKPRKIVCTWHVDRAWREQLREINNLELEVAVYHHLRVLMEEPNEEKFELLLDSTKGELLKSSAT